MALYGTRRTPGVAIFGTVLAMALPILLVGAPQYPVGEWRRTLIWVAVAPRIGVVVQDRVTAESAVPVLERLRNATPGGPTASVGAATFVPGAPLATLVEQADQALHRAKSNGRDSLELVPASV